MDRYAVLGQPIAHSKSPLIHQRFARATGATLSYEAIEVAPEQFAATAQKLFDEGFAGANVTLPHKLAAVGSSRVDLQACKLEYSIVSPK